MTTKEEQESHLVVTTRDLHVPPYLEKLLSAEPSEPDVSDLGKGILFTNCALNYPVNWWAMEVDMNRKIGHVHSNSAAYYYKDHCPYFVRDVLIKDYNQTAIEISGRAYDLPSSEYRGFSGAMPSLKLDCEAFWIEVKIYRIQPTYAYLKSSFSHGVWSKGVCKLSSDIATYTLAEDSFDGEPIRIRVMVRVTLRNVGQRAAIWYRINQPVPK